MTSELFDLQELFRSVDLERSKRGIPWAALARQVGVSTSTIRRFAHANDAEADGVLALIRWLGVNPESLVPAAVSTGELLPQGDGYVRVDMELVARAVGDPSGARGRSRTTIQRLVAAAQHSGQPVAALTRLCDN